MSKNSLVLALVASTLLIGVPLVQAYATSVGLLRVAWNHDSVTVYITLEKGVAPSYRNEVIAAFNSWSSALKAGSGNPSEFNFVFLDQPQSKKRPADIMVTVKRNTGNVLGSTSVSSSGGIIQSVKITLVANNAMGLPLETCDFRTIARHEIGHAIGLGHSNDNKVEPLDLMSPTYDFVQVGYDIYPSTLDVGAAIFVYGNDGFGLPNTSPIPSAYP